MKLMTKELERRFEVIGNQEVEDNPIVVAKFFDPTGSWTWYATEYSSEEGIFFGMVHGFEKEMGYFSLAELESVRGRFGLGIERDTSFVEKRLSQI